MKAAEIVVGQVYAYGTKDRWKTYRPCRVLEVGKHRVMEDSDKEVPAARIQWLDGDQPARVTQWVVLRSIAVLWAEFKADQAQANQAHHAQVQVGPEKSDRARNVVKSLAEMGFDTGTPSFELLGQHAASGFVRVKVEFLEDVLDALA